MKVELYKKYYDKCGHFYLVTNIDLNAPKGYEVTVVNERSGQEEHYNLNGQYSLAGKSIYDLIGIEK